MQTAATREAQEIASQEAYRTSEQIEKTRAAEELVAQQTKGATRLFGDVMAREVELAYLRSSQAGLLEAAQALMAHVPPDDTEQAEQVLFDDERLVVANLRAAISLAQTTKEPVTDQLGKAEPE